MHDFGLDVKLENGTKRNPSGHFLLEFRARLFKLNEK